MIGLILGLVVAGLIIKVVLLKNEIRQMEEARFQASKDFATQLKYLNGHINDAAQHADQILKIFGWKN